MNDRQCHSITVGKALAPFLSAFPPIPIADRLCLSEGWFIAHSGVRLLCVFFRCTRMTAFSTRSFTCTVTAPVHGDSQHAIPPSRRYPLQHCFHPLPHSYARYVQFPSPPHMSDGFCRMLISVAELRNWNLEVAGRETWWHGLFLFRRVAR